MDQMFWNIVFSASIIFILIHVSKFADAMRGAPKMHFVGHLIWAVLWFAIISSGTYGGIWLFRSVDFQFKWKTSDAASRIVITGNQIATRNLDPRKGPLADDLTREERCAINREFGGPFGLPPAWVDNHNGGVNPSGYCMGIDQGRD